MQGIRPTFFYRRCTSSIKSFYKQFCSHMIFHLNRINEWIHQPDTRKLLFFFIFEDQNSFDFTSLKGSSFFDISSHAIGCDFLLCHWKIKWLLDFFVVLSNDFKRFEAIDIGCCLWNGFSALCWIHVYWLLIFDHAVTLTTYQKPCQQIH